MSDICIYHNPRCSKSRQTLALLESKGICPEVILYLQDTPDAKTLKSVIKKLGIETRDLLRKGEAAYKELGLNDPSLSERALIEAMIKEPKLIERPIVVSGEIAIIGRPPENVLSLVQ